MFDHKNINTGINLNGNAFGGMGSNANGSPINTGGFVDLGFTPKATQPDRQIKIERVIFTPCNPNGYQDMFRKKIQISASSGAIAKVEEIMSTNKEINAIDVSKRLSGVMDIGVENHGISKISNGWQSPRYRVIITFSRQIDPYQKEFYTIQGYTSHLGATKSGVIDDNMHIFMNNMVISKTVTNPVTKQAMSHIVDSFQIFKDDTASVGFPEAAGINNNKLARPVDFVNGIRLNEATQHTDYDNFGNSIESVNSFDVTNVISDIALTSSRDNAVLSKSLANVLNGSAKNAPASHETKFDGLTNAHSALYEDSFANNAAIELIGSITGDRSLGYFPVNTLNKIDPTLDNSDRVVVLQYADVEKYEKEIIANNNFLRFITTQVTEDFSMPTIDRKIAFQLAEMVVSLLSSNLLLATALIYDNTRGPKKEMLTVGMTYSSVPGDNIDYSNDIERFKKDFINLVSGIVTSNHNIQMNVQMLASTIGDTVIALTINGLGMKVFRVPSALDSNISSIVTDVRTMDENINKIGEMVEGAIYGINNTSKNFHTGMSSQDTGIGGMNKVAVGGGLAAFNK